MIKRYYQSGSIKKVRNDFTLEFSNVTVTTKKAMLNLFQKFETEHILDLPCAGCPTIYTPVKKEEIKSVMNHHTLYIVSETRTACRTQSYR